MKKTVLIFGGGGYNAIQVYFALKDSLRYHPILSSSNENHSTFVCKDAIINLPYDSETSFISSLNKCIQETGAEYIIPTHDSAAVKLKENERFIHAKIVCSPIETTILCRYKSRTYKKLEGLDFIPKIYDDVEKLQFPVFAKDDVGQGGNHTYMIHSYKDIEKLSQKINYVLCEYLPGNEITVDCFTDRHGNLRFAQARSRERILNGISARSAIIPTTDEIMKIARGISSRVEFRGYWYFQCKQDRSGKYKLMEISTRFAGTFGLTKNLDVNLPLLALRDYEEEEIEISPNQYGIISDKCYIDRYKIDIDYKRVYIDFDDTLVFERKRYNTQAMKFLYQCINQEKKIVLITKHAYDIKDTMKRLRMNRDLFDEVIEVPFDEPKYKYMDNEISSIFIDNAFQERIEVKENLGIPAFDVTNIEALIDWSD